MNESVKTDNLVFHPLTIDRWDDFVELFISDRVCNTCWCMYWRVTRKEFGQNNGEKKKLAMQKLIQSGIVPGIIGFLDDQPVAWCSIAPREDFASLERSHNLKRLDEKPVWSIVCFFIHISVRNNGLMEEAIRGAVEYARKNGAEIVEAYPVEVEGHKTPGELYMGNQNSFLKAGFEKIDTRGKRKFMRWTKE